MSRQTSRSILVLGTSRSGTSTIAGVLHHLGCFMGSEFVPPDRNNPYGTFEDAKFYNDETTYLADRSQKPDYRKFVEEREEHNIWGVKSPTLVDTAHLLIPHLDNPRMIVAKRKPADIINSYMKAYNSGRVRAEKWYARSSSFLAARLMEFDGPILEVQFEELLDSPREMVEQIMHFAFEGMGLPDNTSYNRAVNHIISKPKKEPEGWGSIALGVRIAKHPEVLFFNSWTQLLTGGVTNIDTVLMPAYHMPAHTASNKLARDFLNTDKDTLLLIDDDMMFDTNTLHALRRNRNNWEYDIVAPFCTHRSYPPKPIVMRDNGELSEPESLDGQSFNYNKDIKQGTVEEVDAIGLAFTLIRREVLEAMINEKWGLDKTFFFNYGPGYESDDIPFCRNAKKLGFRIAVDASVCINHVGTKAYGWTEFQEWKREEESETLDFDADSLKPILAVASTYEGPIGKQAKTILEQIRSVETKGE